MKKYYTKALEKENSLTLSKIETILDSLWDQHHSVFIDYHTDGCFLCPHKNTCAKDEYYFSCPIWEQAMGEDL